ncbi:Carboxylesterase 5A [Halocaridina rubra]|uniref:Carboxylic ester hydrolase n=1 Tax=Halocaridina rubra TaxID=373956 RepID=A0AAN8X782_HALRR
MQPGDVNSGKPVMVFIHGGAFFAGGINKYTPYVMLDEDIVLVIIQYRLGMLGFLSTGDTVIPGNFGLKDQVLALQWVQENIHNFGGDPKQVTLFGESAGGASVHFHLLSPYSEGLFARGILQSGTLFSPWAMGGSFEEVAEFTGHLFSCPEAESGFREQKSITLLSCLQGVDVVNLTLSFMNHITWNFNPALLGPRVDGDYLPKEPELLMKEGKHKKIPIISGITSHEGGLFALPLFSEEVMKADLLNNFEEMGPASLDIKAGNSHPVQLAKAIFHYYVGGVQADTKDADKLCQMYGDWHFNVGHDLFSKLYAKSVREIYLYELNHRGQRSFQNFYNLEVGGKWVSHADDLFYLFTGGQTLWTTLERDEDLHVRDILTGLWYSFAASGSPTSKNLGFTWEPAYSTNLQHLLINPMPSMTADRREKVREFIQSLPTRQNHLLHPEYVKSFDFQATATDTDERDEISTNGKTKIEAKEEL